MRRRLFTLAILAACDGGSAGPIDAPSDALDALDASSDALDAPAALTCEEIGAALQAGADVPLGNHWYANVDVKKLYIDTTATFNGGAVRADVDIDPWIVGVGIGYKF